MRAEEQKFLEVQKSRGMFYAGLYDSGATSAPSRRTSVQLLNPTCDEEDATARRFAQIEIE